MPLLYEQDEQIEPPTDRPIGVMFSRLVEDGKAYARAEIERQKIRAAEIGLEFRNIAVLLEIEAVPGLAAVVALLVGLITATTSALELGRAHVRTPVTNAHLVCRLLLEKNKNT